MKICCKCKIEKELIKFGKRKNGNINSECKECVAFRAKQYYQNNKEKCNEKRKEYYEKNKEITLEKSKKRYWENHEQIRKRANEQNRTPERRAKANERGKIWAKKNKEKHVENAIKHRKKYPEKHVARQHIYWALKLGFMKQSEICEICKQTAKTQAHHDDYKKPLEVRWFCRSCHFEWHRLNKD